MTESPRSFEGRFNIANATSRQYVRYENSQKSYELSMILKSENVCWDKQDPDLLEFKSCIVNAICTNDDERFGKYGGEHIGGIYLCREYDHNDDSFKGGKQYLDLVVRLDALAIQHLPGLAALNDIHVTGEYVRAAQNPAFAETEWMVLAGYVNEIRFSKTFPE